MFSSDFIISVSESDFQYEVIQYSLNIPVVVNFWADWSESCTPLSALLELYTEKAKGQFRLAKVDVDENPNLAIRYNIRTVPVVKAFRHGQVVSTLVGLVPEDKIEIFLDEIAPSPADLIFDKANNLLKKHAWSRAETAYRQVLAYSQAPLAALLGLAKCLIAQSKTEEALEILINFPGSPEYPTAQSLIPLANALTRPKPGVLILSHQYIPADLIYQRAIVLIRGGNFQAGLDGLLETLRSDKNYRNGDTHQVILGIFEILGQNHAITRQYRRELASIIF